MPTRKKSDVEKIEAKKTVKNVAKNIVKSPNRQKNIDLDSLPNYIKTKYKGKQLTEKEVEFCMEVAFGLDTYQSVHRVWYDGKIPLPQLTKQQKDNVRKKGQALVRRPLILDTVKLIRENLQDDSIHTVNTILQRMELLYSDEMMSENIDKNFLLKILSEMAKIVTKLPDGTATVNQYNIQFTIPGVTNKDEISEAIDITNQQDEE